MITPRPNPRSEEQRPARMSAVADFLTTKQLSDLQRAEVDRCMRSQDSTSENDMPNMFVVQSANAGVDKIASTAKETLVNAYTSPQPV
ncbi:hypothetical protein GGE50_006367 [Rhizobium leguminosarum]|nr:hypothetical protein [Rhizobium leguminosarum]